MKKLISEQMVNYLERRGVQYIFGLCGHTIIGFLDALSKSKKIKYVSARHEQIAVSAADGYARVTKKASVVLCHVGPGITNTVTGIANAALDSVPMVLIAGDVPSYYYGRHPHQEINLHCDASQLDILKPVVKQAWRVNSAVSLPDILDKAFRMAESGRPGPVLIDIPMDIFSQETDARIFERTYADNPVTIKPALAPATAAEIAKKLIKARRPLIHAGGGVLLSGASAELSALAEFLEIPVSRTLMGQGCISDMHPLMAGQTGFWGLPYTHRITSKADLILALGTRFAETDSSSWYPGVTFDMRKSKLIQIDIDPAEIGRNYPVEIGAVADIKTALIQIMEEVRKIRPEGMKRLEIVAFIARERAAFKAENAAVSNDGRFPMTPQRILKDVKAIIPEDSLIFTDVGWNKNGAAQQLNITVPGTIHHSSGLATMGFGASAVLGGKLAAPERTALALVGDGGFGANPSCMAAAVEQGINVIWVIMNNSAFGTISGLEYANYGNRFGAEFTTPDGASYSPDWAAVAKAYKVKSVRINSADEFEKALKTALNADSPYLIDVPMENIAVPTPGCWNINDIYTSKANIAEGKVVYDEDGSFTLPNHSASHKK